MSDSTAVAVVGAGPSGMFQALYLARRGHQVYLIEREAEIGGFFNSEESPWGRLDPGVFIFEAIGDPLMDEVITRSLPESALQQFSGNKKDISGNYFHGKLNTGSLYPDIRLLPRESYLSCLASLLDAVGSPAPIMGEVQHLRAYYDSRFGPHLTEKVLERVAQKVWRQPLENITSWAAKILHLQRLVTHDHATSVDLKCSLALDAVIGYTEQLQVEESLALDKPSSYYPVEYGLYNLLPGMTRQLQEHGVTILTDCSVRAIRRGDDGALEGVDLLHGGDERQMALSSLLWTSAPASLCPLLQVQPPVLPDAPIPHRVVYLFLDAPPETGELYWFWSFDPAYRFLRVSNPAAFCPQVLSRGYHPLCFETHIDSQTMSDDEIIEQVSLEAVQSGLVRSDSNIKGGWVMQGAKHYFVPSVANINAMDEMMRAIDAHKPDGLFVSSQNIADGVFYMREILRHNLPTLNEKICQAKNR